MFIDKGEIPNGEIHKGAVPNFIHLTLVQRDFLLISGERLFSNNHLKSRLSGIFHSEMFYKVLSKNYIGTLFHLY